jgi:hypothetical protein
MGITIPTHPLIVDARLHAANSQVVASGSRPFPRPSDWPSDFISADVSKLSCSDGDKIVRILAIETSLQILQLKLRVQLVGSRVIGTWLYRGLMPALLKHGNQFNSIYSTAQTTFSTKMILKGYLAYLADAKARANGIMELPSWLSTLGC